jgi:phospholipase/lecithinase/hemolysin
VNRLLQFTLGILWVGLVASPVHAAFTSLYAFGDGVCTTTDNTDGGSDYYGDTYCNGRIWIQVLAQRQGLPYVAANNESYLGQYSSYLISYLGSYNPPVDAGTAMFIVWVADADLVEDEGINASGNPLTDAEKSQWVTALNQSLTNEATIVQMLYNKGVRTLVLPNAVDITQIPEFNGDYPSDITWIQQQITNFNAEFVTTANRTAAPLHGLKIYIPDFYTLLNNVLSNPSQYGLYNSQYLGYNTDALEDGNLGNYALNGPGANYIFWDPDDPTAKVHTLAADLVEQMISPTTISKVAPLGNGSNRLDIINVPIGRSGVVNASTSLTNHFTNWSTVQSVTSTTNSQSVFVPASGPREFYRLSFPFNWTWP